VRGSAAVDRAAGWPAKVRAAVDFTLSALAADPSRGRLVTAEIFLAGPAAAVRHRELVDRLCEPLRAGRAEGPVASRLPASLEPTLIGGAVSLIARHIAAGDGERLAELAPEITYFLLLPYLGAAPAQSVAELGGLAFPGAGGLSVVAPPAARGPASAERLRASPRVPGRCWAAR
jgi:hypothetical protein